MDNLINQVHCLDFEELCQAVGEQSVDLIASDLPYGTTACSWDVRVDFDTLWRCVKRVLKPRGVFLTTASEPFASLLRVNNLDWYKYDWYYEKSRGKNFQQTAYRPMSVVETVLIFSDAIATYSNTTEPMRYYPQNEKLDKPYTRDFRGNKTHVVSKTANISNDTLQQKTYTFKRPRNLLYGFTDNDDIRIHPTQKPVLLYEYLIRTYTQPGDLVLDPFCGSGTTGLAALKTGRRYILGDSSAEYVGAARRRLQNSDPFQPSDQGDGVTQLSLFAEGE